MQQKELRLALVCYGGISLAVYMHGVTKEIWHATRASKLFHDDPDAPAGAGVMGAYRDLFATIAATRAVRLRLLPDIISGASAGGINGVFLGQALASGQSLEPLTRLWLEQADVDVLLDPDARPWSRLAKFWAQPIVWLALRLPASAVSRAAAPAIRAEVRRKVSRLIRARWFQPPFSGIGLSRLLEHALDAMAATGPDGSEASLLPPGHPLDLLVTATDFAGQPEELHLNSPPLVREAAHRLAIDFHCQVGRIGVPARGAQLGARADLVFAARATASFPGAFPPLTVAEIDQLVAERGLGWPGRAAFLRRIMPARWREQTIERASLIDGAVLNNRPFAEAMQMLRDRPAQREVDRRFVYIDPHPDQGAADANEKQRPVGFFSAIFGALSSIPRDQPIRDNLAQLAAQSRERERVRAMVEALRPEIEQRVAHLFGRTLFFDSPSPSRLSAWRARAQQAAAEAAGYAFHGYARFKRDAIIDELAAVIHEAAPDTAEPDAIAAALSAHLKTQGLDSLTSDHGGASPAAIAFFREHDVGFRIRRLKMLARRLAQDWDNAIGLSPEAREAARDTIYRAQALYQARETARGLGPGFAASAALALASPGAVLGVIGAWRNLRAIDDEVDAMLVGALAAMDKPLRRRFLLAYLGFPFYDVATLPLAAGEGLGEFDPIKVDRISPEDAVSIRGGGTRACLKGIEFYSFGAFFSRAYRENDYLWGRLHGAERLIDIIASTTNPPLTAETLAKAKRQAFTAILDEEEPRLRADPSLVATIRAELAASA